MLPSPVLCGEFESTTQTALIYGHHPDAESARLLILHNGAPIGYTLVALESGDVPLAAAAAAARHVLPRPDTAQPAEPGAASTAKLPHITVVVCTRNRVDKLSECLRSLADSTYDNFDVLVVDNAPDDSDTHDLVRTLQADDRRFGYVVQPIPGLSHARNTGLQTASGEVVAFTDDDVQVSPRWIAALAVAFGDSRVKCVTGLVPSQQVATDYERFFERRYPAWWTRLDPHVFDPAEWQPDPLFPFNAGQFGTGANFAVDRWAALAIGGFDAALGAGTRTGGGEDLDYFARSLLAGHVLRYEPSAIVWHAHRTHRKSFMTQIFRYGCGGSAYATKLLRYPSTRKRVARLIPGAVRRLTSGMWGARHSTAGPGLPWLALACELVGYAWGPFAYWASVQARRYEPEKETQ